MPFRSRLATGLLLLCGASFTLAQGQPPPPPFPTVKKFDPAFKDWAVRLRFSPDGSLLAGGSYDVVTIWKTDGWQVAKELRTGTGYAWALAWSPDGTRLAVGGYQKISLYDAKSWRRVKTLRGHRSYVRDLTFSEDGARLLSAAEDASARVYDVKTGQEVLKLTDEELPFRGVAFVAGGEQIVAALGDENRVTKPGPVRLYDATSRELVHEFTEHEKVSTSLTVSASGKYLLTTGEDNKVNVYDLPGRKADGFFSGHARPTQSVVLTADERIAISVSGGRSKGKNELKVWSRFDGTEHASFEPHPERIFTVALSPDESLIATGGQDGSVIIWGFADFKTEVEQKLGPVKATAREPLVAPRPTE